MAETLERCGWEGQDDAALRAEVARLNKVVHALVDRSERMMNSEATDFGIFQATILLERQVHERTRELESALQENARINRDLERANEALAREKEEQRLLIRKLEDSHKQLLRSERMACVGRLAAGVAHEINNPIGFINSNLRTLKEYANGLLKLVDAYAATDPLIAGHASEAAAIGALKEKIDLDYLRDDMLALVDESVDGGERVRRIVEALRGFSHVGEAEWQMADLQAGLNSTLSLMACELGGRVQVVREYASLPWVECIAPQINQVFMNLLHNAAEAIRGAGTITVRSGVDEAGVWISIGDTGAGIAPEDLHHIFDPFYTTKPVGKQGAGLGLFVSLGTVEAHGGRIDVDSEPGRGSTFTVHLPLRRVQAQRRL